MILISRRDGRNRLVDIEWRIRPDDWEVDYKHLIVYNDQIVNDAYFSVVYKGRLDCNANAYEQHIDETSFGIATYTGMNVVVQWLDWLVYVIHISRYLNFPQSASQDEHVKQLHAYSQQLLGVEFCQEIELMKVSWGLWIFLHFIENRRSPESVVACVTFQQPHSLITEYCVHGDLLQLVRDNKSTFITVLFNLLAFLYLFHPFSLITILNFVYKIYYRLRGKSPTAW